MRMFSLGLLLLSFSAFGIGSLIKSKSLSSVSDNLRVLKSLEKEYGGCKFWILENSKDDIARGWYLDDLPGSGLEKDYKNGFPKSIYLMGAISRSKEIESECRKNRDNKVVLAFSGSDHVQLRRGLSKFQPGSRSTD